MEGFMRKSGVVLLGFLITVPFALSAATVELLSTGVEDQTALEVTVYNSNVGLVKDLRHVNVKKGIQELRFMDVAAQVLPATVNIKAVGDASSLTVLEQNYEYDLLSPKKLMDKYVGKTVKLYSKNPYSDREEVVEATILSNNEGVPVFRIGNEITFSHPGRIIFPEIPENLISKPTLLWLLDSKNTGSQNIETLYMTNGINWQADYVLLLNGQDSAADLSGWVTINNKSGVQYRNAGLKLVAGDVHRAADMLVRQKVYAVAESSAKAAQFKEEPFFEYHIYGLERKTTIKDNQTKQISLLEARNIPVKKEFVYRGMPDYFLNRYAETLKQEKVSVYIEFLNKKGDGLGMPLPKGTVRVYKEDKEGSPQFAGEDAIDHTPKDEKIRIRMGNAFDIAASRKQTDWEKIDRNTYEVAFEILLRNHKTEDATVKVVEPLSGDWKIIESSHPYNKVDVFTVSFDVPVKKDTEAKLTYKARIKY